MANQYSADVPKGFNVPKQVRLDSITAIQNEAALKNLGAGNNLAFKYYEGLKVYCKDEKKEYVWRQIVGSETGLLTTNFTYPTYSPIDGIDYSGKSFNFFLILNSNIAPPDGSETKIVSGSSNVTIGGSGTENDEYVITVDISDGSETKVQPGDNISIDGDGTENDPYVISADLSDLGILKTVGNEVIAPGQTLSIITNEVTGKVLTTKEYVQSIIPATPNGSETKVNAGENVTVTGTGTISNPYIINSSHQDEPVYINAGDDIEILGNGSVDNPYVINSLSTQLNTKAEFNERLTDGNFLFVGDVTQYDNEQAQDAIGNILTDTTTVDFTYNDELALISANVKPNSITAIELSNSINISEFVNDAGYITILPDGSETKINNGITTVKSGLGTTASPYVIETVNLQKAITADYTITDADNEYTIFINNNTTPITIYLGTITVPNYCVGFIQEGTGDVTFTGITNPIGPKSKGQGYQTFIERKLSTSTFYLLGNTKPS